MEIIGKFTTRLQNRQTLHSDEFFTYNDFFERWSKKIFFFTVPLAKISFTNHTSLHQIPNSESNVV